MPAAGAWWANGLLWCPDSTRRELDAMKWVRLLSASTASDNLDGLRNGATTHALPFSYQEASGRDRQIPRIALESVAVDHALFNRVRG